MLDYFGRKINYLRLSITDRCDLRCKYCMPQNMKFSPKKDSLTLENLKEISFALINIGIKKIRITGGEPLVRKDIIYLINYLNIFKKKGLLEEIAMTTNGTLLKKFAFEIFNNGVNRLNISLDSLVSEKYKFITNGGNLDNVLEGINFAKALGIKIKINTVLINNFNTDEILNITKWCADNNFKVSFIEVMPLGKIEESRNKQYFPIFKARDIIEEEFGLKSSTYKSNGPSKYFQTKKYNSTIGFISPISNKFCESCNRIRVTSDGKLFGCLGHDDSLDLKSLLNNKKSIFINELKKIIFNKPEKHFFDINKKAPAVERFMSFTGG